MTAPRIGRTTGSWLTAIAIVATVLAISTPARAAGWNGFTVSTAPSSVGDGNSPGWGLAVTRDLGGPQVDIWNNNHGSTSEALIDLAGNRRTQPVTQMGGVGALDTHGAAFSDIDGDGDDDLFEVSGRGNDNRLFRNDGGSLSQVDAGALTDNGGRGRQPLMLDFDGDGDMDVIITNLDLRAPPVNAGSNLPSELYLNNGNGTAWTKVADPSEIIHDGNLRIAQQTSTGPGTSQIVITHNSTSVARDSIATGLATLAEAGNQATRRDNVTHVREVILGDFDGDLHPEMLVVRGNESASAGDWPLMIFDLVQGASPRAIPQLSQDEGLIDNCRSAAAADFDNDGDLDIFAGCAQRQEGQTRNIMLLNNGQGSFAIAGTDVMPATIAQTPSAIVTADINADGWMDAFAANGYDFDNAPDQIFTNAQGGTGHWLEVDLVGSNPDVAGAQVFVGTNKWQVRETGHRAHRSQDTGTLHFGLGTATQIARVEIRWPDGSYSSCRVSGIDRLVTITTGSASCSNRNRAGFLGAIGKDPVPVGGTTPPPTIPPPTAPKCLGRTVTVQLALGQRPTNGDDVILGTAGNNQINGLAGNDFICGLGGNDIITGGDGRDRIDGGRGRDTIDGGDSRDVIQGGAGNDSIDGGRGKDRIAGNQGNDGLRGSAGADTIVAGDGNDVALGGAGRDRLEGGSGADRANGGADVDTCVGFESATRCER